MLEYDEPPIKAWSYSRLRNFEECPYRVALDTVEKREKPPLPDDNPLERGTRVHQAAEEYIKGEREDLIAELDKPQVVEVLNFYKDMYPQGDTFVEQDWGFRQNWTQTGWWDDDVWLRVKLDASTFLDDEKTAALVTDWKTGRSYGKEIKNYEQSALYTIALMFREPTVTDTECQFVYTDEDKIKTLNFKRKDMPSLIKRFTQRALRLTLCTEFRPKPNRQNCHYCPFGPNAQGNNSCPHGIAWQ